MGVSVRRFLKFTALLVAFIALTIYARIWTVAKVPIDEVLLKLRGRTNLPIHIPREVPGITNPYIDVATDFDGNYTIFFSRKNICSAWRCQYANLSVYRGKSDVDKTAVFVQLANGIKGTYTPSMSSYITGTYNPSIYDYRDDAAMVVWQQDGIRYQLFIKNKSPQAAIQLANSTILGEFKSPPASHSGTSH